MLQYLLTVLQYLLLVFQILVNSYKDAVYYFLTGSPLLSTILLSSNRGGVPASINGGGHSNNNTVPVYRTMSGGRPSLGKRSMHLSKRSMPLSKPWIHGAIRFAPSFVRLLGCIDSFPRGGRPPDMVRYTGALLLLECRPPFMLPGYNNLPMAGTSCSGLITFLKF